MSKFGTGGRRGPPLMYKEREFSVIFAGRFWRFHITKTPKMCGSMFTHWKINMEPQNWWFVDVFPSLRMHFQVPCDFCLSILVHLRTIVKYNVELNRATFYYGTLVLLPTIIITYLSFGVFFMSHEVGVSWSSNKPFFSMFLRVHPSWLWWAVLADRYKWGEKGPYKWPEINGVIGNWGCFTLLIGP